MADYQPSYSIGFHSCDRDVGLMVLNGEINLLPSENNWDWLGPGIYFWEQDPKRSLIYAQENAVGIQKNKKPAKTPFVLGAIIDLGNCLNLLEYNSMKILIKAYHDLKSLSESLGLLLPENRDKNRKLDYAVIKYIHQTNNDNGIPAYNTIRCAFPEGGAAYPGAMITSKLHTQLCICNPDYIKGFFLPRPLKKFNPYL